MTAAAWLSDGAPWLATAAAVVSAVVAFRQARGARADADRADRAVAEAARGADQTRRLADETARVAAALQPPPPAPDWSVEHVGGETYVLRNTGAATAHEVRWTAPDLPPAAGITLDADQASGRFTLSDSFQRPRVDDLVVSCAESRDRRVAVPRLPPR